MAQSLGYIIEELVNAVKKAKDNYKIITEIILEHITSGSKLDKIRTCILQYRTIKPEDKPKTMIKGESLKDLNIDQLDLANNLFKSMNYHLNEHDKLLKEIGRIMRLDSLNNDQRIEKISNLLL